MMSEDSFIREFDIDLLNKTLLFYQKIEGDVSCVVWDASIVLAKYLEELCRKNEKYFKNTRIIELGAGLGCVGLTAACLGASITVTDLPEALPLLQLNIDNNKHILGNKTQIEAKSLSWGNPSGINISPDFILLADCVYYEKSIDPLIETLLDLTGSDTIIFLAQEMRDSDNQRKHWQTFLKKASKHFNLTTVPLQDQNPDYCSPDIVLIRLKKL